jgi:hypothetical protein
MQAWAESSGAARAVSLLDHSRALSRKSRADCVGKITAGRLSIGHAAFACSDPKDFVNCDLNDRTASAADVGDGLVGNARGSTRILRPGTMPHRLAGRSISIRERVTTEVYVTRVVLKTCGFFEYLELLNSGGLLPKNTPGGYMSPAPSPARRGGLSPRLRQGFGAPRGRLGRARGGPSTRSRGLRWKHTAGRPPSDALTASGRILVGSLFLSTHPECSGVIERFMIVASFR